jgi:hypothetical protein
MQLCTDNANREDISRTLKSSWGSYSRGYMMNVPMSCKEHPALSISAMVPLQ